MTKSIIHPKRKPADTPPSLVDENGRAVFGTFKSEFPAFNLHQIHNATHLPDALNALKLTQWQAVEVRTENGMLLCAVCDMGLFGKLLHVYLDERDNSVHTFDSTLMPGTVHIAQSLLHGSQSSARFKTGEIRIINELDKNRVRLQGSHRTSKDTLSYDIQMSRISSPSVVSIPFGANRPLYSQKDLFNVRGSVTLNGENIELRPSDKAILDDHRGYYPRRSHYDWLCTMDGAVKDGTLEPFAFNLTCNQSIDQDAYNENLIWNETCSTPLPPVRFIKTPDTFEGGVLPFWRIEDEFGKVNAGFEILGVSPMILHAGLVNIDYYILFGKLCGYVEDEEGNRTVLDGMLGIGEDKTLLF